MKALAASAASLPLFRTPFAAAFTADDMRQLMLGQQLCIYFARE
jgi:hypothetical protein